MTADRHFDHDMRALLVDLYVESAPDYRHDLVRQFAANAQRPAWTFLERWFPVSVVTLAHQAARPAPWRTVGLIALLALLLAALVATYIGNQQPLPAPFGPAANGMLAVAEAGDIVLIDPATGTRTVAVDGPEVDGLPTFSRDGTRLAFLRERQGDTGIFVADAEGQGVVELDTSSLGVIDGLEWSPDGRLIMTMQLIGDTPTAIAIVAVDGSAPRLLDLDVPVEYAVWLPPNGRQILFRSPNQLGIKHGYSLWTVGADGTNPHEIVPPGGEEWDSLYFSPSPNGSHVAYQEVDDAAGFLKVYVVPIEGGTPRAVTDVQSVAPKWSPDGQWLAFFSFPNDNGVATTVAADGSRPPVVHGAGPINDYAWTPDGKRLLVVNTLGAVTLYDPTGGPSIAGGWRSTEIPDWQRLAPTE